MEQFNDKEVIDLTPKEEKVEKIGTPAVFFTVTVAAKNRPQHFLVKATTALDALKYMQEEKRYLVLAVHVTEYAEYVDATEDGVGAKDEKVELTEDEDTKAPESEKGELPNV